MDSTEEGDKSTKYFLNTEKRNFNVKLITELKPNPNGNIIVDEKEIMREIHSFYAHLYELEVVSNNNVISDFNNFITNLEFPKLSDNERDEIEGKLTLKERQNILKSFKLGKSPGEDGYTVEFDNCFFEILGQDLLDSVNASYDFGELSISQRRGAITLVPKEDSSLLLLSNWHPITLLNVDYKIASKVIAERLESVLLKLINPDQTGFVKGRYIGQNIQLLMDALEQTSRQDILGILLLDFRKAFDTLEWPFIQETLSAFNFGESIKHWVSTFYAKCESSVLNDGFYTEPFPLSRGVRQGCPLSPLLFISGAEFLASRIRQDKNIQGIKIYNHEFKISQFADDTSLLCKDLNLVKDAITLLDTFGRVSGLKLNQSKTKGVWLGPWRFSDSKLLGLKWTKDPVRILGIFISYDEKGNYKKNITKKIEKMDNLLNFWRS